MFGWMTRRLLNYAEGRVVLVLEGGYDLAAISESAESCVRALLSTPALHDEMNEFYCVSNEASSTRPNKSARATLEKVIEVHKRFWPTLSLEGVDLSHKEWESLGRQFANLSVTQPTAGLKSRATQNDEMKSNSGGDDDDDDIEDEEDEELEVVETDVA